MNIITSKRFFSFLKKPSITKLGRWKMHDNQQIIDLKVDLANHDCCGGELCTSIPLKQNHEIKDEEEEEEMLQYYMLSSFHLHVKK